MKASEVQRLVTELTDGVMCDGFHGYFFNCSDDPAEALRALELIGASRTASIVRRACARFPGGMPPAERSARLDVLVDVVSPDSNAFEQEDAEFFTYPDDVQSLAAAYLTAN